MKTRKILYKGKNAIIQTDGEGNFDAYIDIKTGNNSLAVAQAFADNIDIIELDITTMTAKDGDAAAAAALAALAAQYKNILIYKKFSAILEAGWSKTLGSGTVSANVAYTLSISVDADGDKATVYVKFELS